MLLDNMANRAKRTLRHNTDFLISENQLDQIPSFRTSVPFMIVAPKYRVFFCIATLLSALSRRRREVIHVIFACAILTFLKSISVKQ